MSINNRETPGRQLMYWWNDFALLAISNDQFVGCAHAPGNDQIKTVRLLKQDGEPVSAQSMSYPAQWTNRIENGVQASRLASDLYVSSEETFGDIRSIKVFTDQHTTGANPETIIEILPLGMLKGQELQWLSRSKKQWFTAKPLLVEDRAYPDVSVMEAASDEDCTWGDSGSPVFSGKYLVGFVSQDWPGGFKFTRMNPSMVVASQTPTPQPTPAKQDQPPASQLPPVDPRVITLNPLPPIFKPTNPVLIELGFREIPTDPGEPFSDYLILGKTTIFRNTPTEGIVEVLEVEALNNFFEWLTIEFKKSQAK